MAADREVIAFLGAGISSTRLSVAPAILGVMGALAAGGVASQIAPASNLALKEIVANSPDGTPLLRLKPGASMKTSPMLCCTLVRWNRTARKNGFLVFDCRSQDSCHTLMARRAEISPRSDRNALNFLLKNGELHGEAMPGEEYSRARFDTGNISMDIERLVSERTRFIPDVEQLSLRELAAGATDGSLTRRERNILTAAWHRRFAFPLASVLFALMGTALTAAGKLRGWRGTLVTAVTMITLFFC